MDRAPELTTTEAALLLACARTRVDRVARIRIEALLQGPIRWTTLLDAASMHGVLPLLHASVSTVDPALVPPPVLERIRIEARANVHHALFLTAELLKLLAVFDAAGVTAIPFKGPVLAAMAYGDLTLRQFNDLDIFVRKSELAIITRSMLAAGYLSDTHDGDAATERSIAADGDVAYRRPSYYTFYRADGRCRVDLQWRMADRFFAFSLEGDTAAWDFATVPIAGRSVRTFAATDALLILCVHGSKHHWEQLKWICDIAECIRAQRDAIDWRALYQKASHLRAERMLGLGLRLAEEVLEATLPAEVSGGLKSDRTLAALVEERRAALFAPAATAPWRRPRLGFYLRTKDGWQDQIRFCAVYVRQFAAVLVKPTARDTSWVALPPPLEPLYYVLRPIRLLTTYARRARWPQRTVSTADSSTRAPQIPPPVAVEPTKPEGAPRC
jgi:hypothetical protein